MHFISIVVVAIVDIFADIVVVVACANCFFAPLKIVMKILQFTVLSRKNF
jgi:hypothetical protein